MSQVQYIKITVIDGMHRDLKIRLKARADTASEAGLPVPRRGSWSGVTACRDPGGSANLSRRCKRHPTSKLFPHRGATRILSSFSRTEVGCRQPARHPYNRWGKRKVFARKPRGSLARRGGDKRSYPPETGRETGYGLRNALPQSYRVRWGAGGPLA